MERARTARGSYASVIIMVLLTCMTAVIASAQSTTADEAPAPTCLPTSSLGVLLQGDKVIAYVPNGSWSDPRTGIRVVTVEGPDIPITVVSTPSAVNSCSSNSATGQTVCTANDRDVYLLQDGTLSRTLKSGSSGTTTFSGGTCQNCGVAVNALTNQAVIAMGLDRGAGIQLLDLGTGVFSPPVPAASGRVSENIVVDPIRGLVLSPAEHAGYGLFKTDGASTRYFANHDWDGAPGSPAEFDSAAEDCTTGIALSTVEFTANLVITDLTQARFTPGSPGGTWTAPGQVQVFPEFSGFFAGTAGIAVAPGSHLGVVTGEVRGNAFGVIQLPASSGAGTPSVVDWVAAAIPNTPTGAAFNVGADPHTVTAYVSPTSHKAFALVADNGSKVLAVIDLQGLLDAPRSADHTVDSGFDLLASGLIRFVSALPEIVDITPSFAEQGQQNVPVSLSATRTHFTQGGTTADFGPGITVASLTVNSATSLTLVLNIDPLSDTGARDVTVTTGAEMADRPGGFVVNPGPAFIAALTPSSSEQGRQRLFVAISASQTHFVQGVTSADFGPGITVATLLVNTATRATALIGVDPTASAGARNVTLTTRGERAGGFSFTVKQGPAILTQIRPSIGEPGQTLAVMVTGQGTHFTRGLTTAFIDGGTVLTVIVNSPTSASVVLSVSPSATPGPVDVTLVTGGETATLARAFTIKTPTPIVLRPRGVVGNDFQFAIEAGAPAVSIDVEASDDLVNWTFLRKVIGQYNTLEFVDAGAATGSARRYYRTRVGSTCSANVVGFLLKPLQAGFNLVTNPLNNLQGNLAEFVLASLPDTSQVQTFDAAQQRYLTRTKVQGTWGIPSISLPPGVGFFVKPPVALTLAFVGTVPMGPLANNFVTGGLRRALLGSILPVGGTLDALGLPAVGNDQIMQWDATAQTWVTTAAFSRGRWVPAAPTIQAGEGFLLGYASIGLSGRVTARSWAQSYSGCPPAIATAPRLSSEIMSGDDFQFTVNGLPDATVVIEASDDLVNWTPVSPVFLAGGRYVFTDYGAAFLDRQFYRARQDGPCSANSVGFVNQILPAGRKVALTNPLNAPDGNAVELLFAALPPGSAVQKWNSSTQSYTLVNRGPGGWSPTGVPLSPGQGFFVQSATDVIVPLVGEVLSGQQVISDIPMAVGMSSFIGSIVPLSGTLDTLGFPAVENDQIMQWDVVAGALVTTATFSRGHWRPAPPMLEGAEPFFLKSGSGFPRNWTQSFTVCR